MKKITLLFPLLLFVISCNNPTEPESLEYIDLDINISVHDLSNNPINSALIYIRYDIDEGTFPLSNLEGDEDTIDNNSYN